MAASIVRLITNETLHRRMSEAARRTAQERFCDSRIVPMYEAFYEEILRGAGRSAR
jgi:hypothetical protein